MTKESGDGMQMSFINGVPGNCEPQSTTLREAVKGLAEPNRESQAARRRKKTTSEENKDAQSGEEGIGALKTAARRIAKLLCELSSENELFVSCVGQSPSKRVDTKALKEFSSVLKEMSAVMNELDAEKSNEDAVLRIEFSDEASELGA